VSYITPAEVSMHCLTANTTVPLSLVTPFEDVKIKHVIVTMFIRGLLASSFQLKINIYSDLDRQKLLLSSTAINNSDIERDGDWYGELRFDFPALNNLLCIGHQYYLEFEISSYTSSMANFVGLVIDHDSPLAIISEVGRLVRHSSFFEVA
jgi:hypothetical protein